jgi:hypothetical protein
MKFTIKQIPGFEDYELISDFKMKCKICNKEMETGMKSICDHMQECIGKNHITSDEIIKNLRKQIHI